MHNATRSKITWLVLLGCLGLGALVSWLSLPRQVEDPAPYASDGWVYEQEEPEKLVLVEESAPKVNLKTADEATKVLLDAEKPPVLPVAPPPMLEPVASPPAPTLPDLTQLNVPAAPPSALPVPELPPTLPAEVAAPPLLPKENPPILRDAPPTGDVPMTLPESLPPPVAPAKAPPPVVPPPVIRYGTETAPAEAPIETAAPSPPTLPRTVAPRAVAGPAIIPEKEEMRRPPIDRPTTSRPTSFADSPFEDVLYQTPSDPPIGFAGPSGVLPRDVQTSAQGVPVEDRWRIGFPPYDRYGRGHPPIDDYLYKPGVWWDPYNQNVLKGDYPILGQNIFLNITGTSLSVVEPRQVPTATTPFESTRNPFNENFFGEPGQLSYQQFFSLSFELFHGDEDFRPVDWRVRLTPVFNYNVLAVDELAQINPDVRRGRFRHRTFFALQEWFAETKIADIGPNYDFFSVRAGSQFFNSDFRGFIFTDTNRAIRFFGNRNSNREQYNLAYFSMLEKDTNSELNTMTQRNQGILIANYYIQDCIWPGYTAQFSFLYNHDDPSFHFDKNDALVRPDPVGVAQPHGLDIFYLGWTGDGHINRFNINHAFYWAFGVDYLNPIANRRVDVSAQMGALELSYDRDYVRFRTSVFWASGDHNPRNGQACGFDAIFDNPNFVGGEFSYWQRQSIRLFGVNLVNRESLLPNLRSSKIQGQSNFVNPGLILGNLGFDVEITPKFRWVNNANFLWFDNTAVLRQFVYANKVDQAIGTDLSMGFEYRPHLNNNVIIKFGVSSLIPSQGFYDLYNNLHDSVNPLFAAFAEVNLTF